MNIESWIKSIEEKRPRLIKRAVKLIEQNAVTFTEGARSIHFTVKDGEIEYLFSIDARDWTEFRPCSCKFGIFNGTDIPCSHVLAGILLLKSKEVKNA